MRISKQKLFIVGFIFLLLILIFTVYLFIMQNAKIENARVHAATMMVKDLSAAIQMYKDEKGEYPNTKNWFRVLEDNITLSSFIKNMPIQNGVPIDPWNHPYRFTFPGIHENNFDVWSYGADAKLNGGGINKDIGNWNTD